MPGVVGAVHIVHMFTGGVTGIGDRAFISPESSTKNLSGSGANSTGTHVNVDNQFDLLTNFDTNLFGEAIIGNN